MKAQVPLVSIVVVTYNSSKYILDTLNSVIRQTYQNWELIITDDCSQDGTVDLCRTWLSEHEDQLRGKRIIITSTPRNLKIAGNYNNATQYIRGEWVKYIAGDDWLSADCLHGFIQYTNDHPDRFLCLSDTMVHNINGDFLRIKKNNPVLLVENNEYQLYHILQGRFIMGPVFFVKSDYVRRIGFDEKYPMAEDWPFIIKYLKEGNIVGYCPKALVCYRSHEDSASREPSSGFNDSLQSICKELVYPILKEKHYILSLYSVWLQCYVAKHNTGGILWKSFLYFLRIFDIKRHYFKLRSRLGASNHPYPSNL